MKTQEEIKVMANDFVSLAYNKQDLYDGFINGYTQCQQDMDKKYTEEDMRKVFEYGKTLEPFDCFEDFIESLNKQD